MPIFFIRTDNCLHYVIGFFPDGERIRASKNFEHRHQAENAKRELEQAFAKDYVAAQRRHANSQVRNALRC